MFSGELHTALKRSIDKIHGRTHLCGNVGKIARRLVRRLKSPYVNAYATSDNGIDRYLFELWNDKAALADVLDPGTDLYKAIRGLFGEETSELARKMWCRAPLFTDWWNRRYVFAPHYRSKKMDRLYINRNIMVLNSFLQSMSIGFSVDSYLEKEKSFPPLGEEVALPPMDLYDDGALPFELRKDYRGVWETSHFVADSVFVPHLFAFLLDRDGNSRALYDKILDVLQFRMNCHKPTLRVSCLFSVLSASCQEKAHDYLSQWLFELDNWDASKDMEYRNSIYCAMDQWSEECLLHFIKLGMKEPVPALYYENIERIIGWYVDETGRAHRNFWDNGGIKFIYSCLTDANCIQEGLASGDSRKIYIALWAMATRELADSVDKAIEFTKSGSYVQKCSALQWASSLDNYTLKFRIVWPIIANKEDYDDRLMEKLLNHAIAFPMHPSREDLDWPYMQYSLCENPNYIYPGMYRRLVLTQEQREATLNWLFDMSAQKNRDKPSRIVSGYEYEDYPLTRISRGYDYYIKLLSEMPCSLME